MNTKNTAILLYILIKFIGNDLFITKNNLTIIPVAITMAPRCPNGHMFETGTFDTPTG